jgi:hippurate hydrolase
MSITGFHRRAGASLACAAALTGLATAAGAAVDPAATRAAAAQEVNADYPHLDALYKDIHAHPELGLQETATAARLAREMRALGFTVTEGVGKTGIVALYHNGPGPTVMVRTELDALPLEEKTGLAYASHDKQVVGGRESFVDHACGHDVHMAIWVGTARALLSQKARWSGTLMFIGQPAEELGAGATAMIKDGLFTRFPKPDYGFALHVGPGPAGEIRYKAGVITSSADWLDITFHGRGGHGSMPSKTIDPVLEAARFVVDVQSVISREKDAAAFGVITVGSIQAGTVGNIIPDQARLLGTIRSYDPEVRARMLDGIARTAKGVAIIAGAPPADVSLVVTARAVVNDTPLTERSAKALKAAFGAQADWEPAPSAASEDYSEFVIAGVPSFFFSLGALDPKLIAEAAAGGKPVPVNHSPFFAPVPEPTIKAGVEAMSVVVINVMAKK